MGKPLRVLLIEDSQDDAFLILHKLKSGGFEPSYSRVETAAEMRAALTERDWDAVISDYYLPQFDAPEALKLLQEAGLDLPFIIVSGVMGEEVAVATMRAGAHDYLMKDNLARLVPTIEREVQEAQARQALRAAEARLALTQRQQAAILNALPAHVALLDQQGHIVAVNEAWRRFAQSNDLKDVNYGLGQNYLEICDSARGESAETAAQAAAGIRAVLSGQQALFTMEYSARSPLEERWFQMIVNPLSEVDLAGAVVTHVDITAGKQAEATLQQSERELRRLVEQMEGLYEVSLEINAQSDLASLLLDITIRAARLLGAKASTLALMQPDGETLKFETGHLPEGRTFKPSVRLGEGLIGQAAQMGKPLMVADYSRWPDRVPGIDWVGRALAAPLAMGEQVVGVITVFDTDKVGDFEAEEIRLLRLFAAQAAIAIEKARLLEAERRERLQAETLREVSLALNSQTDLAAVLDEILSQAGRLVPYRMAHIMLLKGNILTIARWRGYERSESAEVIPALKHTLDELPLDRQAIQSGQPVVVLDTRQEPDWVIFQETAWVRSCLIVPIRLRERVLGILRLDGATPGEFSLEDGTKLQPMVSAAAIALENVRLFEVVRVGRERLQRLSQRLVEAQESERRHIARELHDEIGQSLTALKLHLQNFQRRRDPARIQQGLDLVEETLQQVRNLSLDLRPSLLDELGLAEALRWYLNRQAEIAGFKTTLTLEPIETPLPLGLETTCFRIVQEALTNIIKHAAARQVYLELCQRGSELWLTIADDGGGFDVAAALQRAALGESLGLLNMEERVTLLGGQIEIDSDPGRGARIQARFPL